MKINEFYFSIKSCPSENGFPAVTNVVKPHREESVGSAESVEHIYEERFQNTMIHCELNTVHCHYQLR